jgi:hypothetical protein
MNVFLANFPALLPVIGLVAGALLYFWVLYALDQSLTERSRVTFRYVAAALTVGILFFGLQRYVPAFDRAVDWAKAAIAITAAACVFYETHREGARRPVSERWKKFVGVTLGVAAIVAYFNGFKFGYPAYYHRHDIYHYYMGAKYFKEMGYDGLYKCAVIAQDELGVVTHKLDDGRQVRIDMKAEVRHPDKKIRNLGGDNLLMPATQVLEHPEQCKDHFAPERWEKYKADVKFFRVVSDKGYWESMQQDHGFNPPPVWTLMGRFFAELHPATVLYMQFLSLLDVGYLLGMFGALWWAFGWRVCAVGAIFWGCQSSAPFYWTGGAFLRQDWLFFIVLSMCLARKRFFKLAGASMVYAGLLRIFPGLVVIGWLTVAGVYVFRHHRMKKEHQKVLLGGVLAAAVLVPASLLAVGKDSYQQFYKHTIEVHDQTPLTNHMGLRVLVSHDMNPLTTGIKSGRMRWTKDTKLVDPFEIWKKMRNERYAKYRFVAYGIIAATFAFSVYVMRRVKNLWIGGCLGQVWIILLSQLTCYYYSFMILTAPLTRVKKGIEAPLFGLAAVSQLAWMSLGYNDEKYTALTAISLIFCWGLLCAFAGKWVRLKPGSEATAQGPAAIATGSAGPGAGTR